MIRQMTAMTVALGAVASLAAAGARAESLKPGEERFKFVAGWFLPAFNTDVRIDDTDTDGDKVSLGDDLGLDEDQSGALLGFEWRIADRHRVAASWSQFTQSATRTIDSAGLGALMLIQRMAAERRQTVVLRAPSEEIRFLLVLTKLADLFDIDDAP